MNTNKMALTAAHLNEELVSVLYTQQYLFYTQQYQLYTQQYHPVCSTLNSTSLYALHSRVPPCKTWGKGDNSFSLCPSSLDSLVGGVTAQF